MTLPARPPLARDAVERIRRERLHPRPTQWDYLHLLALRQGLGATLARLPSGSGAALDLYCGAQPYRDLVPRRPLWGVDLDRHFGAADVVSRVPLPFRTGAFSLVLCTQALHLVEDPAETAAEICRVLAPGGYAVVTVPHVFPRELAWERRLTPAALRALFAPCGAEMEVRGIGGVGSGLAYFPGRAAFAVARRAAVARRVLPAVSLLITGAGTMLDVALRPLAQRWPANLILVARRAGG